MTDSSASSEKQSHLRHKQKALEVDPGEPTDEELAHLAMTSGAFDWLKDEPELYTDADLVERFPWAR